MRIVITVLVLLAGAASIAWVWVNQGAERGLMILAAGLFGWLASWLFYKVGELDRRVENLERADLVQRLHKVEWKVCGLPIPSDDDHMDAIKEQIQRIKEGS